MNHMSEPLGAYLNDHLAGATLGSDHAAQLREYSDGAPFAAEAERIAVEVEEDRQALIDLMSRLDVGRNPIKQAGAWVAEKAGRIKFTGVSSGDADYGLYMALETMALGVVGKLKLWQALKHVQPTLPELSAPELDRLIARAVSQHETLEAERARRAPFTFTPSA